MAAACSCGNASAHTIARRSTADGKHVLLWDDGSLTWGLGLSIRGSAFPRTREQSEMALRAGWLVLGDVELYDADEVSDLVRAARRVAVRSGLPGDVRAELARERAPKMPGAWTTLAVDNRGDVTERAWIFPRLSAYSGLAIFHARGRYLVMTRFHGAADTYAPTGFERTTLGEAFADVRTITSPERAA